MPLPSALCCWVFLGFSYIIRDCECALYPCVVSAVLCISCCTAAPPSTSHKMPPAPCAKSVDAQARVVRCIYVYCVRSCVQQSRCSGAVCGWVFLCLG